MPAVTSNNLEYRHKQRQSVRVVTTLYDVIEAVSEQVPSDEKYLVIPAVLKLLRDCRAGFFYIGPAQYLAGSICGERQPRRDALGTG